MCIVKGILLILGRMCLSLIFVLSGLTKIFKWDETKIFYMNLLQVWHKVPNVPDTMVSLTYFMMDYGILFLVIAGILELIGGLMVFFGFKPKVGAILLIIFIIPVTALAHPFWVLNEVDVQMQYLLFIRNIAILGGLLILAVCHSPKKTDPKCLTM